MSFFPKEPLALIFFLPLRWGLSLAQLTNQARLPGPQASGTLFPPPQSWDCWLVLPAWPGFSYGFWGQNKDPPRTLPIVPAFEPLICLFLSENLLQVLSSLSECTTTWSFRVHCFEKQNIDYILIYLFNGYFSSACPVIENRREMVFAYTDCSLLQVRNACYLCYLGTGQKLYNFESECVSFYLKYIRGPDSRPCLHLGLVVVTLEKAFWRFSCFWMGFGILVSTPLFNFLFSML